VPVFSASWDLNGAVKYAYDRYDLRGLPVFVGLELRCERERIVPMLNGVQQLGFISEYRKTFFVDGVTGQSRRVDTVPGCRDASVNWPRNPAQPPPPAVVPAA